MEFFEIFFVSKKVFGSMTASMKDDLVLKGPCFYTYTEEAPIKGEQLKKIKNRLCAFYIITDTPINYIKLESKENFDNKFVTKTIKNSIARWEKGQIKTNFHFRNFQTYAIKILILAMTSKLFPSTFKIFRRFSFQKLRKQDKNFIEKFDFKLNFLGKRKL